MPAGAKLPDHFEIIEQEKKSKAPRVTVTDINDIDFDEPALPDEVPFMEE